MVMTVIMILKSVCRPWQVFVACYVADCPRGRGFSEAGAETGTSPDVVIVVVVVLLLFIIIIR